MQGEQLEPAGQIGRYCGDLDPHLVDGDSRDGSRPRPVSLAIRIRSSTRACARCRASRNPSRPLRVLMTNAW